MLSEIETTNVTSYYSTIPDSRVNTHYINGNFEKYL